jgi:hypothetical protein
MTEADFSSKGIGPAGAIIISAWISHKDKGALSSLNLANNALGQLVDISGGDVWAFDISSGQWWRNGIEPAGVNMDGYKDAKPLGVIALAAAIKDMRGILSLHVGSNGIPEKEMREIMDIAASKESMKILCEVPFKDKAITELDVSGKKLGDEGALVVAEYLDGNGALSSVNLLDNFIGIEQAHALATLLKERPALKSLCGNKGDETELDMSGKRMRDIGAIMLVPEIIDNGALSSTNLLNNNISADQAHALASMLKEHPTLKSLCGNKGDETELDMSGKHIGVDGAIMLASEIIDNGALISLDISNHLDKYGNDGIYAEGAKHIAAAIKVNGTYDHFGTTSFLYIRSMVQLLIFADIDRITGR